MEGFIDSLHTSISTNPLLPRIFNKCQLLAVLKGFKEQFKYLRSQINLELWFYQHEFWKLNLKAFVVKKMKSRIEKESDENLKRNIWRILLDQRWPGDPSLLLVPSFNKCPHKQWIFSWKVEITKKKRKCRTRREEDRDKVFGQNLRKTQKEREGGVRSAWIS